MIKPHQYQKDAFNFVVKRLYVNDDTGAGLFMDPGLGKTLVTLMVLEYLRGLGEIEHALVVAPLRVCRLVWGQEISKWGFNFTTNMLCQRVKAGLKSQGFIDLINPESLHHLVDECHRWDIMIVDESTKFKNWTSKRTKAVRKIAPKVRYKLILTGTPTPNSLADLHAQTFILDGGVALGRNVTVFRSLYMHQGGWQGREWRLRDGQEKKILDAVAPMCLRLDAETNLDMPEKVITDIDCELPSKCVAQYKQLQRELYAQLETGDVLAMNAASAYMKMRQFANGRMFDSDRVVHPVHKAKVEALTDLIDELQGKPLLIFYQFSHDMDAILEKYPKAPVLNGSTKGPAEAKMLADWNAGNTPVFLVQNQAASHGLNMQGAGNRVAYFGLPGGNFEVFEQSYRRIYRQGVKGNQVFIYRLLTQGTVDGVIRDRLEYKDQTQKDFLHNLKNHAREGLT